MDVLYKDFDSFFSDHHEAAYRLAFLLCKTPDAARYVVFEALLALAASAPVSPEDDQKRLFAAVLDECDRYFFKKLRRTLKRERLAALVSFPVTDALWAALEKPYLLKAVAFLNGSLRYAPRDIAKALRIGEKAVERLLRTRLPQLRCLDDITPDAAFSQALLDDVYLRFSERNVPFELKLRRFKRRLDRIVIYVAAAIVIVCIAAILYTANLPVIE